MDRVPTHRAKQHTHTYPHITDNQLPAPGSNPQRWSARQTCYPLINLSPCYRFQLHKMIEELNTSVNSILKSIPTSFVRKNNNQDIPLSFDKVNYCAFSSKCPDRMCEDGDQINWRLSEQHLRELLNNFHQILSQLLLLSCHTGIKTDPNAEQH